MNKLRELLQKYQQEREVLNQLNLLTSMREEIERLSRDRDDELAILERNIYARLENLLIDQEVIKLVEEAESRARNILNENIKYLHTIAKGLLEYETLSGKDIHDLLDGKELNRNSLESQAPKKTVSIISSSDDNDESPED